MTAVALALLASLGWGTADFFGGLLSRRMPVLAVLLVSRIVGLVAIAAVTLAASPALPADWTFLPFAALAGVAQGAGVFAYYRALVVGSMGVVAPVAGVGVVLPVAVGLAAGERVAPGQGVGMALAIAGILLVSRNPTTERTERLAPGIVLAGFAALGLGGFFVTMGMASERADPAWAVLVGQVVMVGLLAGAAVSARTPLRRLQGRYVAVGLLGLLIVAANLLFAEATTRGLLSLVSVIAALFPATTVLLARFVLGERLSALQRGGALAILAGVALIAAG
jgi:uncharacterized membrane protein